MKIKEITRPKNIFIGVLILMNIACITLLVKSNFGQEKHRGREKKSGGHDQFIIDKIGFDSAQAIQFKSLKKSHLQELSSYHEQLNSHRKEMFSNLSNDSFNIDEYSQKISLIQSEMDKMAFNHFKEMRSICQPEQLQKFDQVMQRIMSRMPKNPDRKKRKKDYR